MHSGQVAWSWQRSSYVWLYINLYLYRPQTKLESGPTDGPYQVSIQYNELINTGTKVTRKVFPNNYETPKGEWCS